MVAVFSNVSLSLDDGWVLVSQQLARHSSIQDSGQACQNWIVFVWENPHFILWWMNSIVVMFSSSVSCDCTECVLLSSGLSIKGSMCFAVNTS